VARSLRYSSTALEDLADFAAYIGKTSGSRKIARAFAVALREQCTKLAGLPGILGRPRPELRPDMRSFAIRGYVIFFRYLGDTVEIVRVLERHRDVGAQFDDDRG
jgi:toxin ParE1/3/4